MDAEGDLDNVVTETSGDIFRCCTICDKCKGEIGESGKIAFVHRGFAGGEGMEQLRELDGVGILGK
jgi:hypothetical protein